MDELERLLAADEGLEPSSGLTERVMRAVIDEAEALPPIAFPWRRSVIGLSACLLLLTVGLVMALAQGLPELVPGPELKPKLDPRLVSSVGAPLGALVLAFVACRWSMRTTR